MGTNFYLMTKNKELAKEYSCIYSDEYYSSYGFHLTDEPEFGYEIHIAKTSAGWLPLFNGYKYGIKSVKDIKEAYDTGKFIIYDEYHTKYNWNEFKERVLEFNGGILGRMTPEKVKPLTKEQEKLLGGRDRNLPEYTPITHTPGTKQSYYRYPEDCEHIFVDDEGYEFTLGDFS